MANWSDLHHDLLVLIAKRVHLIEDFVAFGCVCHSWRMTAAKQNFTTLGGQVPWLMLANDDIHSSLREFYSLSKDRIHKVTLPESNGKQCFSSQGWLLTVGKDEEVNLLHPLSRSQIRLPNLRSFLEDLDSLEVGDIDTKFIWKVVLSASPTMKSDYVVMVIYTGFAPKLAFYRAGDNGWTSIDTYFSMYLDVIHYGDQFNFYAVDCRGRLLSCDVNGPNPTTTEVVSILPVDSIDVIEMLYLVKSSSGKLFMVSREGVEVDEDSKYGTSRFQVFEMIESNREWKEVKDIGDEVMFLGDNTSFSIDISGFDFVVCKRNCIYFTDDNFDSYYGKEFPMGGGKDMGVYNLRDGTFEPHFKGESYSRIARPLWVVPTFLSQSFW